MNRIDSLTDKFNSEFVVYEAAVFELLEANEVVDFSDKETLYACTNRREQICQMFSLRARGVLSWDENIELQARTKGFAVDKVVGIAIPMRAALNGAKAPVVDNTAELEALRAQVAELQAEKQAVVRALVAEQKAHEVTRHALAKVEAKFAAKFAKLKSKTVLIGKTLTNVFVSA